MINSNLSTVFYSNGIKTRRFHEDNKSQNRRKNSYPPQFNAIFTLNNKYFPTTSKNLLTIQISKTMFAM